MAAPTQLAGTTLVVLPGEDPAEHARILAAHLARHAPADAAERFWVERIVAAHWRLRRLEAVEALAFAAELAPAPAEGGARPPPSLATLARYGGRIERDLRHAEQRLAALVANRPATPRALTGMDAARLRWLADREGEGGDRGGRGGPGDGRTPRPRAQSRRPPPPRRPRPQGPPGRRVGDALTPALSHRWRDGRGCEPHGWRLTSCPLSRAEHGRGLG